MSLSIKKKWEIVFLHNHKRGSQLNPTVISREVSCSVLVVKFWLKKYEETKDVEEIEKSGRPRKTTIEKVKQSFLCKRRKERQLL